MTNDDVVCAYRLRVLASAQELGSVAAACRLHGIYRSTLSWLFSRRRRTTSSIPAEVRPSCSERHRGQPG